MFRRISHRFAPFLRRGRGLPERPGEKWYALAIVFPDCRRVRGARRFPHRYRVNGSLCDADHALVSGIAGTPASTIGATTTRRATATEAPAIPMQSEQPAIVSPRRDSLP